MKTRPLIWVVLAFLVPAGWCYLDRDREVKLSAPMTQFAATLCEYQNAAEKGPERLPIEGRGLWVDCSNPKIPRLIEKRGLF